MMQVLSHDLHRILSEAALFAHKSADLPTINAVQLECDGTNLVAVATDRFKLAASRLKLPDDQDKPDQFKVTIPLDQVTLLTQHLKTTRAEQCFRQVTLSSSVGGDAVDVQDGSVPDLFNFTNPSGAEMSIKVQPVKSGTFPSWRHLVARNIGQDDQVSQFAVDPFHLESFFKVAKSRGQHRVVMRFQSPAKPVLINLGDDFAGLLMPIRLPGDEPVIVDWLSPTVAQDDDKVGAK